MDPTFRLLGPEPSSRRSRRLAAALEGALWVLSCGCLLAVIWTLGDAWWFQSRAARQWRAEAAARATAPLGRVSRTSQPPIAAPVLPRPLPGAPIGLLNIPRLQVSVVVAEGTSDEVLRHAVGHLSSTPPPGGGNVVLAGHRDTFFRPLEGIRPGDRIVFDDGERQHRYQVDWIDIVDPDRVEVLAPTPEAVLTLVTCYPFRYIGAAPRRFVVRARETGPAGGELHGR